MGSATGAGAGAWGCVAAAIGRAPAAGTEDEGEGACAGGVADAPCAAATASAMPCHHGFFRSKKTSSDSVPYKVTSRKKDPSGFARQELSRIKKLVAALIWAMQSMTQQFSRLPLRFYLELLRGRRLQPALEPEQALLREWWRPELLQRVSAAQERVPQWEGKAQLRRLEGGLAAAQQVLLPAERAPAGQVPCHHHLHQVPSALVLILHISTRHIPDQLTLSLATKASKSCT